MKANISELNPMELRVYGELAHASVNGICSIPMTRMKHRCGLTEANYKNALKFLEDKGLIEQKIQGRGVPRTIKLISEWDRVDEVYPNNKKIIQNYE